MLRLMLNIGMTTSERFGIPVHQIAESRILQVLGSAGFTLKCSKIERSNTEDTLCCIVQDDTPLSRFSTRERIIGLAITLKQDCIAVVPLVHGTSMCLYEAGQLIGPHSEAWGQFDQQFFLEAA